jgi:hypothetical protein
MGRRLEMPPRCPRCEKGAIDTREGFCYRCAYLEKWDAFVRDAWNPLQVRIEGEMYLIGPEQDRKDRNWERGSGFGGRRFRIAFHDGRRVTTHNLWFHGEIPADYREALPNNAVFITKGGRKFGV